MPRPDVHIKSPRTRVVSTTTAVILLKLRSLESGKLFSNALAPLQLELHRPYSANRPV